MKKKKSWTEEPGNEATYTLSLRSLSFLNPLSSAITGSPVAGYSVPGPNADPPQDVPAGLVPVCHLLGLSELRESLARSGLPGSLLYGPLRVSEGPLRPLLGYGKPVCVL